MALGVEFGQSLLQPLAVPAVVEAVAGGPERALGKAAAKEVGQPGDLARDFTVRLVVSKREIILTRGGQPEDVGGDASIEVGLLSQEMEHAQVVIPIPI